MTTITIKRNSIIWSCGCELGYHWMKVSMQYAYKIVCRSYMRIYRCNKLFFPCGPYIPLYIISMSISLQVKSKAIGYAKKKGRGQELASKLDKRVTCHLWGWEAGSKCRSYHCCSSAGEGRRGVKERRIWLPFLLLYETIMYSISVQIVVLLDAKRGIYIYDLYCNCGIDRGSFLCHFLHACYIYMTK